MVQIKLLLLLLLYSSHKSKGEQVAEHQTSFKYNAAKSWNTLPPNLLHDQSLTSFKLRVKNHLNHLS